MASEKEFVASRMELADLSQHQRLLVVKWDLHLYRSWRFVANDFMSSASWLGVFFDLSG